MTLIYLIWISVSIVTLITLIYLHIYVRSKYYSPHSFEGMENNLIKYGIRHSFSIFLNNIRRLYRNLENLQSHLQSNVY